VLTVEHLFAALAGLGLRTGVTLDVVGPEIPLIDGCARAFVAALLPFAGPSPIGPAVSRDATASKFAGVRERTGPLPERPAFRIARLATLAIDDSLYRFSPADSVVVSVSFQTENPAIVSEARWEGSPHHFRSRIAGARTFATQEDLEKYAARGVRATLSPEHLVVIGPERLFSAGEPATADEPARHKLLDLIGDLYLHGGPFEGAIHATRPGHARTHEAILRAFREGILLSR
jgi:UDP-3-O-[3-hydroxymyristoyl] N-acetylglucosamine deacetylase